MDTIHTAERLLDAAYWSLRHLATAVRSHRPNPTRAALAAGFAQFARGVVGAILCMAFLWPMISP